MTERPIGGIRRAQMITTYGVGSVVAVDTGSYMIAGIDRWPDPGRDQVVHEPRLQRALGVHGFRLPPASEEEWIGDVPVVRFPLWQSCPECNRLQPARKFGVTGSDAKCKPCDMALVPSRFVVCCIDGHADDFPYFSWVHKGSAPTGGDKHELRIEAKGRSAALSDIVVSCTCGKDASMEGALSKKGLFGIVTECSGRRPWLGEDATERCPQLPRAMQRGASGVWFSDVTSSISIPPWSEGVQKLISKHWRALGKSRDARGLIEDMDLAKVSPYSVDEITAAVQRRKLIESGQDQDTLPDIKTEEYEALSRTTPETGRRQEFVCLPSDQAVDADLGVAQVMRVTRLREIRVLKGFTRLQAPTETNDKQKIAPLYKEGNRPDWLPAIEVIGEGVFLRLDPGRLAEWETRGDVTSRVAPLNEAYRIRFEQRGAVPDRTVTPRLVLLHTFAHAVINEWSLDCGYPAAALRERLYSSDDMAGVLIYTATSDSAGSLGGIVAQVEAGGLARTIRAALNRSTWCSADPLCIDTVIGGVDNLNRAACHACALLPETSCEEFNTLLDRGLLVGTPQQAKIGFFDQVA